MSDWIGPNVYRITSYKARTAALIEKAENKTENGGVVLRYGTK
jgi:hypothetical protein